MITIGNVSIRNAIICDDIRQEKNNKFILLGVFAGDILMSKLPGPLALSFYLEATIANPGEDTLSLKLSGPGEGSARFEMRFVATTENQIATFPIRGLEVLMETEGTLRFEASADQENWFTLIEKEVVQREGLWSLNSISSELFSAQSEGANPD